MQKLKQIEYKSSSNCVQRARFSFHFVEISRIQTGIHNEIGFQNEISLSQQGAYGGETVLFFYLNCLYFGGNFLSHFRPKNVQNVVIIIIQLIYIREFFHATLTTLRNLTGKKNCKHLAKSKREKKNIMEHIDIVANWKNQENGQMLRMRAFVSRSTGPSNSCCQSHLAMMRTHRERKKKKG